MPGGAGARAAAQIAKEATIGVAGVSRIDLRWEAGRLAGSNATASVLFDNMQFPLNFALFVRVWCARWY